MSSRPLDFNRRALPWIDAARFRVEDYVRGLDLTPQERFALRGQLFHWMWHGFVVLPGAVEPELIDALWADVEEAFADHGRFCFQILSDVYDQHAMLKDTDPSRYYGHRSRLVDFHHPSVAGKRISLHPNILAFVRHLFHQQVVMMQSLLFLEGSQQLLHQDHAYVIAKNPSHLCASWVALEDIDPAAGPLTYVPGSHAIPLFNWGRSGVYRRSGAQRTDQEFTAFIEEQCAAAGLEPITFCPKKGDVLIWHAALAHGGSAVTDPAKTRRSYVTHYSTTDVFKRHYRDTSRRPVREELNGAVVYHDPTQPQEENVLRRGEHVAPG